MSELIFARRRTETGPGVERALGRERHAGGDELLGSGGGCHDGGEDPASRTAAGA